MRGRRARAGGGAALLVITGMWGLWEVADRSPDSPSATAASSPSPSRSSSASPSPSGFSRPIHTRLPTRVEVVENASAYAARYSPPGSAEVLRTDGGNRVAVAYDPGRGLVEQHYSARAGAWSRPQLLYRTRTEPCPEMVLKNFGGTVAVMANFARFCGDGEPPTESIAAVGIEGLERWEVHLTERFDGWTTARASSDAEELTFRYPFTSPPGEARLQWRAGEGFSDLVDIPR